ncbi:NAD(P)-binding protein [Aspergillus steynii IBT 23096]|uniref:NAD(P)-binding protein n=1 Tax=Aspergillus steynii IBT 23096 TaxID=1392250 RepID=A0A2I2GKE3_9EURO|nr:NAD(P)-binding protein [Aspergillus steynii IBT 23096]PLB53319.1 NAD(P)-binding protein [Aspergillus steynii IBT 23096]
MPSNVLITGANRGLGLGLAKRYLNLPGQTVIALIRDPSSPSSTSLRTLPKHATSRLIILKYDASIESDAFDAIAELRNTHGINTLDIVFANAGIAKSYPLVKDVTRAEILEHVDVNALAVVSLYQAGRELLEQSTRAEKPVFAIMGSGGGAVGRQPPVPSAVYGASKSLLNWYGVRINAEDEWLNTFILDPGWSATDMGNTAAKGWGLESAPDSVDEVCDGIVKVVSEATKGEIGGKMIKYTGEVMGW